MAQAVKNVAIVGASGNCGSYITEALLKTGTHNITALTRTDSTSKPPAGVTTKQVNYSDPATLVAALKGQDALVITMNAMAPAEQQSKLIEAAAEAGVPWILPNEWAFDSRNVELGDAVHLGANMRAARALVEKLGKSSWIAVASGFWFEWSLSIPVAYGFDFAEKAVTLYDGGEAKVNTSTWPQVGRAVAALLSLPADKLEQFRNQFCWINSFNVTQKEMLDSALRVTGTKIEDWKVESEPSEKRYQEGTQEMMKGDRTGFGKMLYARLMYADGSGNFLDQGCDNEMLGLPQEDLDEYTRLAIERSKNPGW